MAKTIFIQELKKDKARYKEFLAARKLYLVTEFDEEIKSRLRKIYWGGFFQALIYMYYMPTDFETIGNKVELLSKVFEDEDYNIIHASTNSTRRTHFFEYNQQHLDFNSYIEIKKGNNTWIYDLYSMLKFDKHVYETIEEPKSHTNDLNDISLLDISTSYKIKQVSKLVGETDYSLNCIEIYIKTMEKILELLDKNHPYYEELVKEIELQKQASDFDELKKVVNFEEKYRTLSLLTDKVYPKK